jgi:hypothetical protein
MASWMRVQVGVLLAITIMIAIPAHAQEDDESDAKSKTARRSGYLNLSIGVYDDEKMEDLPAKIETDGTFRKLTHVQWNPETRTMRFNPKAQGVGTLVIKDPQTGEVYS